MNPDEVLAQLDGDTRAYLRILLGSGAQALSGDSPAQLRESFKRFAPTTRDARRITQLLALRRQNVRRVVHNFQELATELGSKDRELAGLVGSSNANFEAIARQDQSLRGALRLLPGTLEQTRDDADQGQRARGEPRARRCRSCARAPARSGRRCSRRARSCARRPRRSRNQLRPFARDVRPTVRELRRAATDLAVATPRLRKTFKFVNTVLNELAYNPPGSEEGFLFWNSWAAHNAATVFGTQDAHGPVRRGLLVLSCDSLSVLDQIKQTTPSLKVLIELLNAPRQSAVCPGQVP